MYTKTLLSLAVLSAAFAVQAADPDYSNGGTFTEDTDIALSVITSGDFVRQNDGSKGQTVTITGADGLTISGGTFSNASVNNPVRDGGVVISPRGYNIGLVEKVQANGDPAIPTGDGTYDYYTEEDIKAIFATGDEDLIRKAFLSSDTTDAGLELPLPTESEVLAALAAKNEIDAGRALDGWTFTATTGDLTVNGGTFIFNTMNKATLSATDGKLVWNGGELTKTNGGGDVTLSGSKGIDILSGSIHVYGADENGPYAQKYDDRNRQDRDRWTLGQYLYLQAGDGAINVGEEGSVGPDIYFSEGQIFAMGESLNIKSGTMVVEGNYRSTLLTGSLTNGINLSGGSLTISTGDAINRNGVDSASMTTLKTTVTGGTLTLNNAQVYAAGSSISGGTVNLNGDSAFSGNTGDITISGGTINVDTRSFVGAIKGDSLELSPYVTANNNITVTGGDFTFKVAAPTEGTELVVGQDIGGFHATADGATISITEGATFAFDVASLGEGEYTVKDFISLKGTGTINTAGISTDRLFYTATAEADSGDLIITVKNAADAVSTLTGDGDLADNAGAYAAIASTSSGIAATRIAEIWQMTGDESAAAKSQVAKDLRDITNPGSAAGMFGQKNAADLIGAEVFNQATLSNGTFDDGTGKRIWGTAVGDWGRVNGESDFDVDTAGVVFGADHTFDRAIRAGFTFGALHTSSDGEGAEFTGDSYWVGLYGSWKLPMNFPLVLDADVMYGWTDGDIDTTLLGHAGSADVDGDVVRISAHASMPFDLSVASVVPYIGLEWTRVSQDGYDDGLGREVDSIDEDALTMPIGVRFVKTVENGSTLFKGTMDVAYARDLTDFDPRLTTSYAGVGIDSESADIGKDAFRFGLGVDCHLSDAWTIGAKYKLEVRDNYTDNQVKATVNFAF